MSDYAGRIVIRTTRPADFEGIIALCRKVYPGSAPWTKEQLISHLTVFPEGQFVAIDPESHAVVGMAASLIVDWNDYETTDDWRDFTDGGFFTNHDPENGRTLYGAEVMVDSEWRGQGVGRRLYDARNQLVQRLRLLRIRAGARLRGYHRHADRLSPQAYTARVTRGEAPRSHPDLPAQARLPCARRGARLPEGRSGEPRARRGDRVAQSRGGHARRTTRPSRSATAARRSLLAIDPQAPGPRRQTLHQEPRIEEQERAEDDQPPRGGAVRSGTLGLDDDPQPTVAGTQLRTLTQGFEALGEGGILIVPQQAAPDAEGRCVRRRRRTPRLPRLAGQGRTPDHQGRSLQAHHHHRLSVPLTEARARGGTPVDLHVAVGLSC